MLFQSLFCKQSVCSSVMVYFSESRTLVRVVSYEAKAEVPQGTLIDTLGSMLEL